ncbi:MAG: phasin family protein [Alphaproteobacteria bacterium]|jgi:phasin family protein|uniref:phasin family protein n=1 Tax=Pacificispira sp. TaxID=2888761 RepID=UPI001B00A47C|nr:phasin family protein [Alphaproteobacteria bacterium]MBO6865091.1 phasin family protein [Alphaproteobacteria bacterium]MEC9268066.1 phasin family protein [Pseudomonadota bacterium]
MTTAKKTPTVDTKPIEEAVAAGKQTVEQAVAATKEQVEKASTAALKSYDEFAALNKDTVDAYVKAGNVFAKGFEDLGKTVFAFAQSQAETNVNAAKALMSAKTINDVVEIQSDLARTQFDAFVAEGTKVSEMSLKVANETVEPIQAQFNVVVEKMMKPVAA